MVARDAARPAWLTGSRKAFAVYDFRVALVLSILALVVAVAAAVIATRRAVPRAVADDDLPEDVSGLRSEVAALRADLTASLRHLAVVRYDAFSDMGGHLSWSVALLDDEGSGVVLTSIHGRQDTRSYAKPIVDWTSDQPLSPEEETAVGHARG